MPDRREWDVTGMDCAACVSKVKGALGQIAGVQNVEISLVSQKLRLTMDENAISVTKVEEMVRSLGYGIRRLNPATVADIVFAQDATNDAGAPDTPWYKTGKGRLVVTTGILLVLAWGISLIAPNEMKPWPFVGACLVGLFPVARRALASLRVAQPFSIEALMMIAAIGALFIGAAQEAALVVFLFAVGELLEGVAVSHARDGIRALGALVPKIALREDTAGIREVPAVELRLGDVVLVRPGDRIPADGEIISGVSGIDESPVTGESVPVSRGPTDAVFAGSVNTEAALRVRVTRTAADNTISRIIHLVEQAEEARAPTQRFIDRFSRWYMPTIVVLSAVVVCLPPLAFAQAWSVWVYRGLSLLLIGCPCALVISVPAAIASALALGAHNGLLIKGGAVIEATARVKTVALDKTGTLTLGRPDVTDIIVLDSLPETQVLAVAAAVEGASSHPLAQAILRRAQSNGPGIDIPLAQESRAIPGRGVTGRIDGMDFTISSPLQAVRDGALSATDTARATELEAEGKTVAVLYGDKALALIALRDEPRADAAEAMRQLRNLGITPVILTGDNSRTAAAIASMLGAHYKAELLPEQKLAEIRALAAQGGVMMVGDGINDAPALKQATVGVAIGSGTDVALEAADAAILRNRVSDIPALIRLARSTMRNVRQNVSIALGLKGVFLIATIAGLTGLWIAIAADTGATVLVTLNALRLLRSRSLDATS